jgi:NADH:ubiquinone oxidoreductase subunit K
MAAEFSITMRLGVIVVSCDVSKRRGYFFKSLVLKTQNAEVCMMLAIFVSHGNIK